MGPIFTTPERAMLSKSTALTVSFAALLSFSSGCDTNPQSSSGTNSSGTVGDATTGDNYSAPGTNPGLSGAAPHPEPQQPATSP